MTKQPDWYDEDKLVRLRFAENPGETGWAVDMGNDQYRLTNTPIAAMCGDVESPRWGDLVQKTHDGLKIVERYQPTKEWFQEWAEANNVDISDVNLDELNDAI